MIDQACLASLDGLIWLRTGHHAESKLNQHQTTISRNSRKCAKVFNISLERRNSEWQVIGDQTLLKLERTLHQHVRFQSDTGLRLEAQHWSGPLLCTPAPTGWIPGNLNFLEYHRPLQLIKDRIVDAWLASYPDTPDHEPDLATIRLSKMPLYLVVKNGHPLLDFGNRVTFENVSRYPLLPLPDRAFPKFQQILIACGLAMHPSKADYHITSTDNCQGSIEDLMVNFASPLTLPLMGDDVQALPLTLPIEVGDALVVPREFVRLPQIQKLAQFFRNRLSELAPTTPELCIVEEEITEPSAVNTINSATSRQAAEGAR